MMDHPDPRAFDLDLLAAGLGAAPEAPLAMPTQKLGSLPEGVVALPAPGRGIVLIRAAALAFSLTAASAAFYLFLQFGLADGEHALDWVRAGLIWLTTWWLAWGAAQAGVGLLARAPQVQRHEGPLASRAVILVPVYNEDPEATFARIAAMDASLASTGERDRFSFAILSDTRSETIAAAERAAFVGLVAERGEGRLYYRRRSDNRGRKAGNIEEFLTRHGAAWDLAIILDADSLMDGATLVEMVRRMEAAPRLGLLQTLPRIVRSGTVFARAQAFSAALFAPVFARGQAAMQGACGPFWGHNAAVRIRAFTEACGLPHLRGRAPFGGAILSHDYVEAAMLARAGWQVRLDTDLGGSFEEGPATLLDHAKRDRRWAQGNLQHIGVIGAAGLAPWHRFTLFQGIFAYLAPLFWIAFMAASIAATLTAGTPEFFVPGSPYPIFPVDRTGAAVALVLGIFGLLFLPKLLIALQALRSGRAGDFGGAARVLRGTLGEILVSSLTAPVHLMFQTRAVAQILCGRDGGWPASQREGGRLSLHEAWSASRWISLAGLAGLVATAALAPVLLAWLAPVLLPMAAAPAAVALLSWPTRAFATPEDLAPPAVLRRLTARLGHASPEPALAAFHPPAKLANAA